MKIPHRKRDAHADFWKINLRPIFFSFFRLFLSEIMSRWCRLPRTTSDPAQKNENFKPKLRFFLFFRRRKFWHDFVTPFSTFANIKGSLPTNSTTLNRLRCRARSSDEEFSGFWPIIFSNIAPKKFFRKVRHLVLIYTPKEAHSRISWPGGHFSRDKCWQEKQRFSGRRACGSCCATAVQQLCNSCATLVFVLVLHST